MDVLTTLLELLGLVLIVTSVALIFWPAALGVAGLGLLWLSRELTRKGTA